MSISLLAAGVRGSGPQHAGQFGLDDEVDRVLDRFAGLDPNVLRVLGADRLPALPIHSVGDAQ
jgi:hypothetical protein